MQRIKPNPTYSDQYIYIYSYIPSSTNQYDFKCKSPKKKACYANYQGAGGSGGSVTLGAFAGSGTLGAFAVDGIKVGGSLADDGSTLHLTYILNN